MMSGMGDNFFEGVNDCVKKFSLFEQDGKDLSRVRGDHQLFELLFPLNLLVPNINEKATDAE